MKLSACIIARNEEQILEKCLQSLRHNVDEIVLVDTGSIDRTVEIAKRFGCRVFTCAWEDDFSAAKNFALRQAKGDWIVFLDADEYFSADTCANLRSIMAEYGEHAAALQIKMVNLDSDRADTVLDYFYKIRIFKNAPHIHYAGAIHENLTGLEVEAIVRIPAEKLLLYHTGYSANRIAAKCRRNLAALKKCAAGKGETPRILAHLADAYYGLGEYAQAARCATRSIEGGYTEVSYGSRPYRIVLASLRALDRQAELESWIDRAMQAYPTLPDFYFEKSYLLHGQADYDDALTYAHKALALHEGYEGVETSLFEKDLPIALEMIAKIFEMKHEPELARYHYETLLRLDVRNTACLQALYRFLAERGDAVVLQCFNAIYAKQNQADMRFLADAIGRIHKGRVYLYYAQAAAILSGERIAAQDVLIGKENFVGAVSSIADSLRVGVNFFALALLLCADDTQLRKKAHALPDAYKEVLLKYADNDGGQLSAQGAQVYDALLSGLLRTLEKEKITRFSRLALEFATTDSIAFADRLQNFRWFEAAAALYRRHVDAVKDAPGVWRKLGICSYRLERYQEAKTCFEKAIAQDEKDKEAQVYLQWMVEKKTGESNQ